MTRRLLRYGFMKLLFATTGCWSTSTSVKLVTDVRVVDGAVVGDTCDLTLTNERVLHETSRVWSKTKCQPATIRAELAGGAR